MCASVYTCVHVCADHEKWRWALGIGQTRGEAYFLLEWSLSGSHFYTFNSRCGLYWVCSCLVLSLWIKTLPGIPKNNRGKKKKLTLVVPRKETRKLRKSLWLLGSTLISHGVLWDLLDLLETH